LADELVHLCDTVERYGFVDFQMGIAEDEIIERELRTFRKRLSSSHKLTFTYRDPSLLGRSGAAKTEPIAQFDAGGLIEVDHTAAYPSSIGVKTQDACDTLHSPRLLKLRSSDPRQLVYVHHFDDGRHRREPSRGSPSVVLRLLERLIHEPRN
jgi:hypothetical protein